MFNKKAVMGGAFQDIACLIVIVIFFLIFFFLLGMFWNLSRQRIEVQALEHSLAEQSHYSLYAFLQKQIELELQDRKQNITIADLIRLSYINDSYRETLKEKEKATFGPHYDYIFRIMVRELIALNYPRAYIPSNETILAVLQLEKVKK